MSWFLSMTFILCFCLPLYALAETVYKSIDKDGNVSYSTRPQEDAVKSERMEVERDSIPSDEGREATAERLKQINELTEELQGDRKQREQERQAKAKAEQEVEEEAIRKEEAQRQNEERYPIYYPYPPSRYPPLRPRPPIHKPRPPGMLPQEPRFPR